MTNTTTKKTKFETAKRIAKIVVINSTSATVGSLVKQNVAVEGKLAKAQLFIGAYALSLKASSDAWDHVEASIDEIATAVKDAKSAKDDTVNITTA